MMSPSPRRPNKSIPLALFLAGICLSPFSHPRHRGASAAPDEGEAFVVAGYLPDYRAYVDVDAPATHLTDLMLFSLTPMSVMKKGPRSCCFSPEHYDKARRARSRKRERRPSRGIRLLVTVGGAGRSDGFREVVTGSSDVQLHFMKGLVKLCRDEELDGIDLDFEGIQSQEVYEAYLNFLLRAAKYLHRRNLLLTVALHPGQPLPGHVCRGLDRVHVMTYDMTRPAPSSADGRGNHHAAMPSVREAISQFESGGCPPSKLVVGIPAYGRHEEDAGLVKTYSEAVDEMAERGHGAKFRTMRTWKGYRFDGPGDVAEKTNYARENGLGGVFFWELGQDKQMADVAEGGVLLETAANAANLAGVTVSDEL